VRNRPSDQDSWKHICQGDSFPLSQAFISPVYRKRNITLFHNPGVHRHMLKTKSDFSKEENEKYTFLLGLHREGALPAHAYTHTNS
jgi:hypothetical protein